LWWSPRKESDVTTTAHEPERVVSTTKLTIDHVAQIMPGARANGLDREWQSFLKTCHDYEITTKNRLAAFLMNVAKESGELYYVEEIADGWDYEWREDLGNTQQGDGPRYKGHGYIQITGRLNHRSVGEALGVDFEANPLLLTKQEYAWPCAGWYWRKGSSWGNLNEYADAGDFRSTILGVRGGPDLDREHYWWTALSVLPDDVVVPEPDEVEEASPVEAESSDELLDGWPVLRLAIVGEKQWLMTQDRKKYVALEEASDATFETQRVWLKKGGLLVPPEKKEIVTPEPPPVTPAEPKYTEPWPEEFQPVGYLGDGSYIDWHPTRYTWAPLVDDYIRRILGMYPGRVWANTYIDHPPGFGMDDVSVDFWDWAGRAASLDSTIGREILNWIFNDQNPPWINWCIYEGYIWTDGVGWQEYWDTDPWSDAGHWYHLHITFHRS
jgi:predicted chitinase